MRGRSPLGGGSGLPPIPVAARHAEFSAILSADDDPGRPSDRLLDLALRAIQRARSVSMADVVRRMARPPYYPDVWPGEHYKLLAALAGELRPEVVVEVGTATELSALALRQGMPPGSEVVTFDVVPWDRFPDTALRPDDFADGGLRQVVADVGRAEVMRDHTGLFRRAGLVFVDGPKDGAFEARLLALLDGLGLTQRSVVVLDDTRVWPMLGVWRGVRRPKLDLTSFGHWSGTGLVDWE